MDTTQSDSESQLSANVMDERADQPGSSPRPGRIGNVRWAIAILLGIGILINYFDRVNISVATKPLEHDFQLSAGQMGIVLSSVLWSYALLQIPVGELLDRIGITWLMRVGTILWSLATFLTALAGGWASSSSPASCWASPKPPPSPVPPKPPATGSP